MTVPADVIVLSSSPDPPQRTPKKAVYDPEARFGSSPPAATPLSLLQLPSRSRFFPTPSAPNDATKKKGKGKTKTAKLSGNDKDDLAESQENAKKATKVPTKSGVLAELEPGSLDSRKNVTKKAAGSQKGWSRASAKSKEQTNMTLAGKVTKSSNELSAKDASKSGKKASAAEKSPSESENQQAGSRKPNALEKDEDLHLDGAMRRRMDWTPPRETNPKDVSANDTGDGIENDNDKHTENAFGKVLSSYNYTGLASGTCDIASNSQGEGPTKRRRIELVDPQVYPPPTKRTGVKDVPSGQEDDSSSSGAQLSKKAKSQKRFKTLTARMTAQYTNDIENDDSMDVIVPDIGKAKSRRGKEKTKDQETKFVVLSPETAFKTLDDQNLIFGTCSQLEREDSPETLREMQQAMRESDNLASQKRERRLGPECDSIDPRHTSVSRLTGARNLWGVATRNTEGSLVQGRGLDTVDLTEATRASPAEQSPTVKASAGSLEDDWFDLDYGKPARPAEAATLSEKLSRTVVEPQAPVIAELAARVESTQPEAATDSQKELQQSPMPRYEGFTDAELSKQVAGYGFKSVRGRKKMIELLQKCWESKHGKGSNEPQTQSQSSSQSTSRPATSKEIQSGAQPASKSKKSNTTKKPKPKQKEAKSAQIGLAASVTPKKSSRKASGSGHPPPSSFIDVEEIQDSEEEVFLSPSQVQKRYTDLLSNVTSSVPEPSLEFLPKAAPQSPTKHKTPATKPPRISKTLSSSSTAPSTTESSRRCSLPDLFTQITKAIRAQPKHSSSLGSRSRPTWHEKILMYDPVILEDLTAWLNVEGLGLVGEDREVGTATVREWCEGKGICCCWKKNASW